MNRIIILIATLFFSNNLLLLNHAYCQDMETTQQENNFGLIPYLDKDLGLYGYKKDGKVVIEPKYSFGNPFSKRGIARVHKVISENDPNVGFTFPTANSGLDGFIDTLGNIVIPVEYGVLGHFDRYDEAEFCKGVKVLIDGSGYSWSEKFGIMNIKGEILTEPTYDWIKGLDGGKMFYARNGDVLKTIDSRGKTFVENGMFDVFEEHGNYYYAEKNGEVGAVDRSLEVVIPFKYPISGIDKREVIDLIQKLSDFDNIIQSKVLRKTIKERWEKNPYYAYSQSYQFNQDENNFGLTPYLDNDLALYGYKKDGKVVIEPKYSFAQPFSKKGIARVHKAIRKNYPNIGSTFPTDNDGLDGFIDTLGNIVFPVEYGVLGYFDRYDEAEFCKGVKVLIDGSGYSWTEKFGIMNIKGEVLTEPIYDWIEGLYGGKIFYAENGSARKIIDSRGKTFVENGMFDFFEAYGNYFYAEKNGKAGAVDRSLEVVIPFEYPISRDNKGKVVNLIRGLAKYDNIIESKKLHEIIKERWENGLF